MVLRVWLSFIHLDIQELKPFGNLASRISQLKGNPITSTINSSSFSSMATIVRWKSSIGMSLCPLELTFCLLLWAVECWERSWSCLLFSVSLRSAPLPNLLNTFLDSLLPSLWPVHALLVCPLVPTKVGMWEHATLALRLTPVRWVPIAIGFSPVYCILVALKFSFVCYILGTLGFSRIHCEGGARYPLVGSFLFVPVDAEPCGECSGLRRTSSFACEYLHSSRLVGSLLCGSHCCGAFSLSTIT